MMTRKKTITLLAKAALACCLGTALLPASAQPGTPAATFPTRAVKFIVPFPPGGAIDALARLLGQHLSVMWKQPVVVENRPGAGGIIGTEQLAKSAPDGYTIGMGAASTHGFNAALYKKLPYDTLGDFAPVAPSAMVPNVLVTNASVPVQNVQGLIAMARAQPGKLSYASAGGGTTLHLSCELFKKLADVDIMHVPYKGSGPALADVMGGQVPVMCDSLTSALPHIRSGKLKALGVTSRTRSPLLPNVPTLAEAGVKGYELTPWYGVFAPAGTPPQVVAQMNADIQKVLKLPEVKERLTTIGAEAMLDTPEGFAAMVRKDLHKWGGLIKEMGITVD
ncbi:tripartite tricarboxylate transporter substrate binding protein [Ramlibacter sp. GTP1]|uniref:Tripartite tricarboxylate transporter substrate binding protein n=2 Tax=Ramlibacter albus TaxID=2079448 RepID=A0A923M5W9_9BURK|nr:tripartite tricarboxylate transporter substrate binding protein [Ramlibacter albus]